MTSETQNQTGAGSHVSASKEDQFRDNFVTLVAELATPGRHDQETMTVIGLLAKRLIDGASAVSWGAFKRGQTAARYDATLKTFQEQGNALLAEKKLRTAYVVQVLAMSLIARTQQDSQVQAADRQLDSIIDFAASAAQAKGGAPN